MRIRTQCRECGLPYKERIDDSTGELLCPNCGHGLEVAAAGWSDQPPRSVEICPLCSSKHLYRQKDVNRVLACLLVVIGIVFVPWTYGLSLVVLSLVDLALYYRLSEATVCYRCDTVYRDARPGPRQKEFNLLKHDVLKYGKSWTELEEELD
jgi:hypothetical protein